MASKPGQDDDGWSRFDPALVEQRYSDVGIYDLDADILVLARSTMRPASVLEVRFPTKRNDALG